MQMEHHGLRARLERIWYGGEPPPWWLTAWVPLYRALRALHLLPYRLGVRRAQRVGAPVIVVGNLVAGGSGKTPLVIALVEALRERGFKPGVVSRGYGGRQRDPHVVTADDDPRCVGDEPSLIHRQTGAPVVVARDRVRGAKLLTGQAIDVVIADDGLQNPSLARDLELCVIDGERGFGNGHLLPAGPLREPTTRWVTVDARIRNGGVAEPGEFAMRLLGDEAVSLHRGERRPLDAWAGQRVHAVAGIGHPARFFAKLREHGLDVIPHAFPDHHPYTVQDFDFGDDQPVLMTEKDAIKCAGFADARLWAVPVRAELPGALFDAIARQLRPH